MSHREIRALLRGATAALIAGWQGPHRAERSSCIAPAETDSPERALDYVIDHCEMLMAAGVKPLYRDSEPLL